MVRDRRNRELKRLAIGSVAVALALAGAGVAAHGADREDARSPTVPTTPSVLTDLGVVRDGARQFDLKASEFTQQIANFPIKTARFWGYNGSTPGPTLVAYEGEAIRVVLDNQLPVPTTVHLHGLHQPNEFDGVAGISQPDPVQPGGTFT